MNSEVQISELLKSIHHVYGYDFTEYSELSVARRIEHFMKMVKTPSIPDLTNRLIKDEQFFAHFVQEFTINVTEMFRDADFYKSLRDKVLPRLSTYPIIKIWLAGCSTGEEAYSTAILLKEAGLLDRSIIYATDINERSLQAARKGLFAINNMKLYSRNYLESGGKGSLSDYYVAKYNSVLFDKSLGDKIVFSAHNLTSDKSFNEFQLIMCRNVMIYFNQKLQNKVVNLFYESLCSFGFLATGNRESLLFSERKKAFVEVDRKQKIYRRLN